MIQKKAISPMSNQVSNLCSTNDPCSTQYAQPVLSTMPSENAKTGLFTYASLYNVGILSLPYNLIGNLLD